MGFCNLKSKTGYAFYLLIYTPFIFRRMLKKWIIVSGKGTWGLEVKRGSRVRELFTSYPLYAVLTLTPECIKKM